MVQLNKTLNKLCYSYYVVSPELEHTVAVENWVIATKLVKGALFTLDTLTVRLEPV